MKILAWVVLGVVLAVILAMIYYLVVGAILFKAIFARRSFTARALQKNLEEKLKRYKVDLCWWEKVKFEKVSIRSFDGLNLVGHINRTNSENTVIVCHGFGQDYREMQQYCKFFHDCNFNVLAVDMRAHGQSEGSCVGFGWLDSKDIVAWVDFVHQKWQNDKILLFGLSMGAASVCMASGNKDLKNIEGIISDCAFDNADREITHVMKRKKLNFKILRLHVYSYVKRVHGFDVKQADAIKQVKNTKVPILFIHGLADDFVPVDNLTRLYNSTPTNLREKYLVADAKHALSYPVAGAEYEKKIRDFLKKRTKMD